MRKILITGATGTLGQAVAEALATPQHHLLLTGRNPNKLEELDDSLAGKAAHTTLISLDVSKPALIDALGQQIHQQYGKLDAWIHCIAAITNLSPVAHQDPSHWDRLWAVNVTATLRLIRSLDVLLRADDSQRRDIIITHCTMGENLPFWGAYHASRAAQAALVTACGRETEKTGLKVQLFDPQPMASPHHRVAFPGVALETLPSPQSAAQRLLALLA